MRKLLKYFLLFFVLVTFTLGFLSLIPIFSYKIYSIKKISFERGIEEKLSNLPNYKNIDWANKHFKERTELSSDYNSYIGWKRNEYKGETITITKEGFRKTVDFHNNEFSKNFLFFGGSTMWGFGTNDENTIPSIFSKKTEFSAFNFAQDSYQIRQSSNALINFYNLDIGKKNKNVIISFEGANDVVIKCEFGFNKYSHEKELKNYYKKRDDLKNKSLSFGLFILPFQTLLEKYRFRKLEKQNIINTNECLTNDDYAEKVVDSIILSWKNFDSIAKINGDRFVAILQPILFTSNVKKNYLNKIKTTKNTKLNKIFLKIYPKIIKKMKKSDIEFYDFSKVFDNNDDKYIYIDWVHYSPNGYNIVTDELIKLIKK